MTNRDVVGIDINDIDLKLAHVRHSPAKREVVNLLSRNIGGLADAEISKIIGGSFHELKAKNPDIINMIPSHLVITKNIEVPSTDPREIKEIINLQAGRHTPYSREEIIVDYINLGAFKHSYTKILLVIVGRNVIKRQFDILDKAGLRLQKVSFAPESLAWSTSRILKLETEDSPVSIIHIDGNFTDFTIVFKGKAMFIRSIPIGVQYLINEKEKYEMRFIEELKKSLDAYQNENIEKNPNMLVLTGAIEELKGLEATLTNNLQLPVRAIPYFKNLLISDEALKAASLAKRLSFLNIIAPLLAWEEIKVDLIPEEIKLRKSLEERGKDLIKTGIFILTVLVLVCITLISNIYFKSAYLKNLYTNYQTLNQEAEKLEKDFIKVSLVRNYLSARGYPLDILSELHNIAPLELEIDNIRYDEQGKFNIKGTAESMSAVFSFVDNMEKSKYFKDVKTRYTSKRKEGSKDVTDFEIIATLEKRAE